MSVQFASPLLFGGAGEVAREFVPACSSATIFAVHRRRLRKAVPIESGRDGLIGGQPCRTNDSLPRLHGN